MIWIGLLAGGIGLGLWALMRQKPKKQEKPIASNPASLISRAELQTDLDLRLAAKKLMDLMQSPKVGIYKTVRLFQLAFNQWPRKNKEIEVSGMYTPETQAALQAVLDWIGPNEDNISYLAAESPYQGDSSQYAFKIDISKG